MIVRSILFNLAFYVNLVVWALVCLPTMICPRRWLVFVIHGWARSSVWLLRVIAGIAVEVRGVASNHDGPLLIAAKHQSLFETFALLPFFSDPAFIMKRELNWIPFFGWWTLKMRMIPIDRRKGARALKAMAAYARAEVARNRQILIFPEGTRRAPGDEPDYKSGVATLYKELGVPCLPVALNSGLFWPRRKWQRYPGTIVIEFLEPIPPGLPRRAFLARLQADIETASDRLLAEAAASDTPPPLPATARARLGKLGGSAA